MNIQKGTTRWLVSGAVCSVAWSLSAGAALAADAGVDQGPKKSAQMTVGQIEDIVVTATRRETASQRVPAALTAISGAQLASQGIDSSEKLIQAAPSLYVQSGLYSGSNRFSIRGLSSTDATSTGTSPAALYIDDVYQASQFGSGSQLFDLQRVEVLRGPQGTLFGRNTTAGAVQYFSQTPTNKFEGYVLGKFAWGSQDYQKVEGAINLPLTPDLAVRVSGQGDFRHNYIQDVNFSRRLGHGDTGSGRLQLHWTPGSTSVNLTVFGATHAGDPPIYHGQYVDPCSDPLAGFYYCPSGTTLPAPSPNPRTVYTDVPRIFENWSNYGATLRIEQPVGSINLTSITAYKHGMDRYWGSDNGLPGDFFHAQSFVSVWQFSQELRAATDASKPLSGVAGLFFSHDQTDTNMFVGSTENTTPGLPYGGRAFAVARDYSRAIFGSATWRVIDGLSVIGGIRYTAETRHDNGIGEYVFNGTPNPWTQTTALDPNAPYDADITFNDRKTWTKVTWDATVNYALQPDVMVFGKVARGFRSGGFVLPLTYAPIVPDPVNPEVLTSYEAGFKSEFFNHRLRVNASVYHYDFSNQQVFLFVGGNLVPTNAGKSKVDGAELEVQVRPTAALSMGGTFGYNNARFTKYDDPFAGVSYAGKRLPQAPEYTATFNTSYELQLPDGLVITPGTDWSYRSRIFFEPDNYTAVGDKPRAIGNARIALSRKDAKWSVTAFVDNLTNQRPVTYAYSLTYTTYVQNGLIYGIGRQAGLQVKFAW